MLPASDGFEICRRLRGDGVWTPVLMLTARDAVDDRVSGLDAGADDYLTKPFAFEELLARLRALARRAPAERPPVLEVGELRLDPAAHRAWRGEHELELSAKEFALLELFMRRPGVTLTRTQLLDGAWDMAFESRSNVVDVYVRYLREKIDRPFGRDSIETVRGVGYRLRADGGREPAPDPRPADARLRRGDGRRARRGRALRLPARRRRAAPHRRPDARRRRRRDAHEQLQPTAAGRPRRRDGGRRSRSSRRANGRPSQSRAGRARRRSLERERPAGGARGPRVWLDERLPGRRGEWRVLAVPRGGGTASLVVARSLAPREESLDHLAHELLIFRAAGAARGLARRLRARGRRAASGRGDAAARAAAITAGDAGQRCRCRRRATRSAGSR